MSQIKTWFEAREPDPDNKTLFEAIKKMNTQWAAQKMSPPKPLVESHDDATLIMEMLRRGFAVAKMPARDLAEELGKSE